LAVEGRHFGLVLAVAAGAHQGHRPLEGITLPVGEDEDEHDEARQDGQKGLLPFPEELEGVESHWGSSAYVVAVPPWPGAGLDTRENAIVWVSGGPSPKDRL